MSILVFSVEYLGIVLVDNCRDFLGAKAPSKKWS
jgi:hypothetical protein